ncbi:MAG TPA: hypothetical protein VN824_08945, partial [Puia sp.]|nr:hypothetical protein [Puia sp.]
APFQKMIRHYCGTASGNGTTGIARSGSSTGIARNSSSTGIARNSTRVNGVTRSKVTARPIGRPAGKSKKSAAPKKSPGRPAATGKAAKSNAAPPEVDFTSAYKIIRAVTKAGSEDQRSFTKALDFIVGTYNDARGGNRNVLSDFANIRKQAANRGARYSSVFPKIGIQLNQGMPPDIDMIERAASYTDLLK